MIGHSDPKLELREPMRLAGSLVGVLGFSMFGSPSFPVDLFVVAAGKEQAYRD
jgi:hypothetical protein